MDTEVKKLYENMVDFKRFAIVLLSAGSFFYIGMLLPSNPQTQINTTALMMFSLVFLAASFYFFFRSKKCKSLLLEMEKDLSEK